MKDERDIGPNPNSIDNTEIVAKWSAISAAVSTLIMAVVQFGESFGLWTLDDAQRAAITALWVAIVGCVTVYATMKARAGVFSQRTVAELAGSEPERSE